MWNRLPNTGMRALTSFTWHRSDRTTANSSTYTRRKFCRRPSRPPASSLELSARTFFRVDRLSTLDGLLSLRHLGRAFGTQATLAFLWGGGDFPRRLVGVRVPRVVDSSLIRDVFHGLPPVGGVREGGVRGSGVRGSGVWVPVGGCGRGFGVAVMRHPWITGRRRR